MIYAFLNVIKIGIRDEGVFFIDHQQKKLLLRVDTRAKKCIPLYQSNEMAKLV